MNIRVTDAAEGLKRRAFTVDDIWRMVETGIIAPGERFELIGGEIVPMSPKGIRHERFKAWLNRQLVKGLPDHLMTIPETTFYLSDDTFIEPDFVVYPADSGLERLSPETCLLAVEIADSWLAYDLGRKARLYAEFGIGELWVFDVNDMAITIHRDPANEAFASIERTGFDTRLTPARLDGFALDLSDYRGG
ncbi:Uma2 family endonuclease [Roseitalea porphyridii]|uniref:Uma2 family endonuclease n=1 Tax=Roseitalea porphyridii TaxID=1852022 RepID=A0A4P6UYB5_9HYPH|nr:Uma2 family endonuclease [Roseitalea porphyridii]QBK30031.1 Uma2 family endonuclease [Roseitalea porphyridii]